MSCTDSRIDCDRSLRTASTERGRQLRLNLRQQRADRVDDLDRVRARLPLIGQVDRARAVEPARLSCRSRRRRRRSRPRRAGPDGRRGSATISGRNAVGVHQLAVGLHGERAIRAVERAGRPVDAAARRPRRATSSKSSSRAASWRGSTSIRTANFCAPKTFDLRDALHHGDALRDVDLGVLVDLARAAASAS